MTHTRKLLTHYAKTGTRNHGSHQSQRKTNLAKLRKIKLLTQTRKLLTRYAKTGTRNQGSQQSRRKPNLAHLRKVILLTQEIKLLTRLREKTLDPLRENGDLEQGISTKLAQNQSGKVEKNKTTDTYEKLFSRYAKTGTRNQGS